MQAQIDPTEIDLEIENSCASLVNIQKECLEDETVEFTFQIANNSQCNVSSVSFNSLGGLNQNFIVNIPAQSISSPLTLSFPNSTIGTSVCYNLVLNGNEGGNCCSTKVCFDVKNECCKLSANVKSVSCGPNATAHIVIEDGVPPYSGPGMQTAFNNFIVDGLSEGSHTLTYKDSSGCEIDLTFVVDGGECCGFDAELILTGGCAPNAWARIFVSGGTPPYIGPGTEIGGPGNFIVLGLSVGDHVLTYYDANRCEISVTVSIKDCCGFDAKLVKTGGCGSTGWAQILVYGGLPPYTSGNQTNINGDFIFLNLESGTHTFEFTDANGCIVSESVTIKGTTLNADLTSLINPTCTGDGSVIIEVSGGSPPYFGPSNSTEIMQNIFEIDGLAPGDYTFTFEDSKGCGVEINVSLGIEGSCSQFTFNRDETDSNSNGIYTESLSSGISGTIDLTFFGYEVPDSLVVSVNGVIVVNLSVGSSNCDGASGAYILSDFCINECDIIEFEVYDNICSLNKTLWDLELKCSQVCDDASGLINKNPQNISLRDNNFKMSESYYEELELNSQNSILIYPNPVNDFLNISNLGSIIEYQTAKVFNASGSDGLSNLIC